MKSDGQKERDLEQLIAKLECAPLRSASPDADFLRRLSRNIKAGQDILGDLYSESRPAEARRITGMTYTPPAVVADMLAWARAQAPEPGRIIDPGAGTGRFIVAAGKMFPKAELIAIETDPFAARILKLNAKVLGLADRIRVVTTDFRKFKLSKASCVTLFIGNPPYVRHHKIGPVWKQWYVDGMSAEGIKASALSGLHTHFLLKTSQLSSPNDVGIYVTPSEWLDVNYGSAVKTLLLDNLGIQNLSFVCPTQSVFDNAMVTTAFVGFKKGHIKEAVVVRKIQSTQDLNSADTVASTSVSRDVMRRENKWTTLISPRKKRPKSAVQIGDLFSVHRGQITGSNKVWIYSDMHPPVPSRFLVPAITRAQELIGTGSILEKVRNLRCIVSLPASPDDFVEEELRQIKVFLSWAKARGADQTYIALHRRPWWRVALRDPAPILCTYMARRPPHFVLNAARAANINISHGLYPRERLDKKSALLIVKWLNAEKVADGGRVYAGGLMKYEPKEIERIFLPSVDYLHENARPGDTGENRV